MKKHIVMIMLSALMITVTGCGQSAGDQVQREAGSGEEQKQEGQTEEGSAAVEKKEKKHWVIATDTNYKPFEYEDLGGNLIGIDIDLIEAIAQDQDFEYTLKPLGFDAAVETCRNGDADAVLAAVTVNDDRKNDGWIFSNGYFDSNQSMAVAVGSSIRSFKDMAGKKAAVKTGTISSVYAEKEAPEYSFNIAYYDDSPSMYEAVASGKIDACFDDTHVMASTIKETGIGIKILKDTGNDSNPYAMVIFDPQKQELLDSFNTGLADIRANGKYDEIMNRYLMTEGSSEVVQ